ncbi:ATL [Mytilus edulis]|uniref:ATL n=1 Tax=Mytilus edulis TaxID=6550 RepID=A0A8S3PUR0_MYTED|nr:ATL [Mytilus edulis]
MDHEILAPVSAQGERLKGHPIQIVEAGEHTFKLNEEALERVLLNPEIQDKKVAVVSVAGAFRKGKSFLLDFFLRYLNAKGDSDWLGDDESPLEGFSWRGGSERETTGILLWSEPFVCKTSSGEEIVVLLMDTQGAFDSESTVRDCATVFALSTMISSVQVYNITQNIQEDDLQHLQLFTEYGRLALEANDNISKPFQCLEFLVRDWSFPYEADYGAAGGRKILERRLQISDKQHNELQQLRSHIKSCFENIGCFLMPHPGLKVATNPKFDGRLKDIEPDFKDKLQILVPLLLDEDNLKIKEMNGQKITCRELVEYFKQLFQVQRVWYTKEMEKICGGDKPYLHAEQLEREHIRCLTIAMDLFDDTRKMGGKEFSSIYKEQLQKDIEEANDNFKSHNEGKNFFSSARTPAVLFSVMAIAYFLSGFFEIIGIESFASLMNWALGIFLILLITWIYCRYSGDHASIGQHIDQVANVIWDKALMQIYTQAVQQGIKQTAKQAVRQNSRPKSD